MEKPIYKKKFSIIFSRVQEERLLYYIVFVYTSRRNSVRFSVKRSGEYNNNIYVLALAAAAAAAAGR